MSAITIFTTGPQCIRCKMTKHAMDKKGVPYTEINIREDLDAATYVTEDLGYSEAPIVGVVGGGALASQLGAHVDPTRPMRRRGPAAAIARNDLRRTPRITTRFCDAQVLRSIRSSKLVLDPRSSSAQRERERTKPRPCERLTLRCPRLRDRDSCCLYS